MNLSKYDKLSILIIVIIFALSFYVYPTLPAEIPTHWNAAGEADGFGSSNNIFLFPAIILLVYLMILILPKIAVFRENIKKFKYFQSMKLVLVLFFTFFYLATLLPTKGYDYNMTHAIMPALGILFLYFGYVMPHMKRNFFIGIRTPWTLANDLVWKKTHAVGGKLFMLMGLLMFVAIFLPVQYFIWIILLVVFGVLAVTLGYSYWLFVKTGRKKAL